MARRPGAGGDRHSLLSSTALPASSLYPRGNAAAGSSGSSYAGSYRPSSAASSAHGMGTVDTSDPYAEYGAVKKEAAPDGSANGYSNGYSNGYGYGGYGPSTSSYGGTNGSSYSYGGGSMPGGTLGAGPGGGLYGADKTTGQKIGQLFGMQTADQLEEANDERLEGLTARVRLLKDITVGIGNEVRDSTKDLDSLSEAFNNTSAFLGNTFKRMNHMARRQGGWFCNMMLFIAFVIWIFVFLWWWRR